MADSIRFTIDGSLAELTLAAPERRNAIGSQEIQAVKAGGQNRAHWLDQ